MSRLTDEINVRRRRDSVDIVNFAFENDTVLDKPISRSLKNYSPTEIEKFSYLRAVEWRSWPAFLSVTLAQPFFLFYNPLIIIGIVIGLNTLWAPLFKKLISIEFATLGVYINKAKIFLTPFMIFFAVVEKNYLLALFILLWAALIANLMGNIRPPVDLKYIQTAFLEKIYGIKN